MGQGGGRERGQGGDSYVSGEQGWDREGQGAGSRDGTGRGRDGTGRGRDGTGRGQLCERGAGMGQGGGSYVSGEQGWDREGAAM